MKTIRVNLKKRSYDILIGKNSISKLNNSIKKLNLGTAALIVTNQFIKNRFGRLLTNELKKTKLLFKYFIIPNMEKAKSFKYLISLLNEAAEYGQDKKLFFIAFGGGVAGDLTGFSASIYKRGVPYIQIPTTLLAQVDSAIGGKTAINLNLAKNLVGSYYQPRLVLSDLFFLKTLPVKEIKAGLSEIIKYAIIKDSRLFERLEKNYSRALKLDLNLFECFIIASSSIKANITAYDEQEKKGERLILNFGHTIGHAIEAAYGYRYSHGQAIALGMIYETRISCLLGLLSKEIKEKIEGLIKNYKIAPKISKLNIQKILYTLKFDKKFIGKINKFTLPTKIGSIRIVNGINEGLIRKTLTQKI